MAIIKRNFTIDLGATFNPKIQYAQPTFSVVPIQSITKSGRAVVLAEAHGLTVDWPVFIVGVKGMDRINHRSEDLDDMEKAYQARFVDSDTLKLEVDSSRFGAYVSDGELMYRPPVDLTGLKARMMVRASVDDDEVLLTITTEDGGILLGGASGIVEFIINSEQSEALSGNSRAVYDLELVDEATTPETVTRLVEGSLKFSRDNTR